MRADLESVTLEMQIMKAIFLLCCLLAVRENHVEAGVDLFKVFDCAEIVIDGVGYVAVKTIPLLTNWAKCVNFAPNVKGDIGLQDLFFILNKFLKKIVMSSKCLEESDETFNGYVGPYVKEFIDGKCLEWPQKPINQSQY
ncbi:uncharacterized protein LOC108652853 [Drosophila navojoa]|uniref:uncharacterized protein LOC108652853 n=1 Tax=Drosophila navojoa TaxID=7232 RepID=UPI0011BD526E|nr:uncharacterized protein LOC108652853 [Drosophila navojoa]